METDAEIHKKRNWVATVITLVVLFLIALFIARVLYYADLIRSGDFDVSNISYTGSLSTSLALATQPIPDGEFNLVSDDDPSVGSENAPVTIVEFADFGCPYSREVSFVVRKLVQENPDKIRYIYRDFPIVDIHPIAQKAAEAGECAQEQGDFWSYHDKLYANQNDLSEERLYDFARELSFDMNRFRNCLDSGRYASEVKADHQAGLEAGVRGTPTFFINGNRIAGSIPEDIFEAVIDSIAR